MIAFGPAPSRRLGRSLGINHIPAKICSYSCVYCQLGRTMTLQTEVRDFFPPARIFREVNDRVARLRELGQFVDFLTFVPDGEPTLDKQLGEAITLLKRETGIRVAVITNGSLVWREDVREALAKCDWLSIKVDASRESAWRRVNRPHPHLKLDRILDGILQLAQIHHGELVTETMLVGGVNDGAEDLSALAEFLAGVHPSIAYLSIPTRPPAEMWVHAPEEALVNRAFQILSEQLARVELLTDYEGSAFAFSGNAEEDLLGLASVHPLREDALSQWLMKAGADWSLMSRLLREGHMVETKYNGWKFYLRNLHREPIEGVRSAAAGED
jgi:wyosine [tRNA(Phe)-imidazoG37] synthetase (radical SAM superfamily)